MQRINKFTLIAALVTLPPFTSLALPINAIADIPPPSRFSAATDGAAKSNTVVLISADDAVERGQESHPGGSVYATGNVCSIVLDVIAGVGVNALLNVVGNADALTPQRDWVPEIKPIPVINTSRRSRIASYLVPLRHSVTAFFISTSSSPGTFDEGTSIGGPVRVLGTAVFCNSGNGAAPRLQVP